MGYFGRALVLDTTVQTDSYKIVHGVILSLRVDTRFIYLIGSVHIEAGHSTRAGLTHKSKVVVPYSGLPVRIGLAVVSAFLIDQLDGVAQGKLAQASLYLADCLTVGHPHRRAEVRAIHLGGSRP